MAQSPLRRTQELRLVLALFVTLCFVLILHFVPAARAAIQPLSQLTATISYVVIQSFGIPVTLDNVVLSHPEGFRFAVDYSCTSLVPGLAIVAVLFFGLSLSWPQRIIASLTGLLLISLLNHFRLLALYYIGVVEPAAFQVAHDWIGQMLIVIGTGAIAYYWIDRSTRQGPVRAE